MDATIIAGIIGAVITIILGIVSMWWASVLNKRQIQATLQAAQPAPNNKPVRKVRKKVFGPKQRHVLKILGLMRLVITISLVVTISDVWIFTFYPRKLYLDIPLALIMIFVYWSGIRAVLIIIVRIGRSFSGNA